MESQQIHWQPREEILQELINIFQLSTQANNLQHQEIAQKITEYSALDEFWNYLSFILNLRSQVAVQIRQICGLTLKSKIEDLFPQIPVQNLEYVKMQLMESFYDEDQAIRKTTSQVISAITTKGGFNCWPDILQSLARNLSVEVEEVTETSTEEQRLQYQQTISIIENSMACIAIIIEDSVDLIENEAYYKNFQQILKPISDQLIQSRPESVKANAINSINMLMISMIDVLNDSLEEYLTKLLELSQDQSMLIKQRCMQGISNIMDFRIDLILQHSEKTFQVLLQSLEHKDQKVSLAASEFWSGILLNKIEEPQLELIRLQSLEAVLPTLLPLLMDCCKFTAIDLMNISSQATDDDMNIYSGKYYSYSESVGEEGVEEDEEEADGMNTLRRASAYAIDQVSKVFQQQIFPILKPRMEEFLQNNESIQEKECAIIVLGAISDPDGAYQSIISHLSNLVPFLIQELKNASSLIRTTTCWTLSKFSEWISHQQEDLFKNYLSELLKRVMDSDSNVQESACTAFSELIIAAKKRLEPYISDTVQVLNMVFDQYHGNSLLSLYDCIGCLAENLSDSIIQESNLNMIMPPLLKKWNQTDDFDKQLCPLFECFESLCRTLGPSFETYSRPVIERCIRIIQKVLQLQQEADISTDISMQKELLIRSINLLKEVFRANNGKVDQLISQTEFLQTFLVLTQVSFLRSLFKKNTDLIILQYTFALAGFLPEYLEGATMEPLLDQILSNAISHIGLEYIQTKNKISVCNNAIWCLGVYSINFPEKIIPAIPQLMVKMTEILLQPKLSKSLAQNSAVCIGRLALIAPEQASVYIAQLIKPWCLSLRNLKASKEKDEAFQGICKSIPFNPSGVSSNFPFLCDAFCEYRNASKDLEAMFGNILQSFKQSVGDQWQNYFSSFPQKMKESMEERFAV